MTSLRDHVVALNETRLRVWNEAQGFLDDCQKRHPNEEMSGEERAQWERYNERLDNLDAERDALIERETRESDQAAIREAHAAAFRDNVGAEPAQTSDWDSQIREFLTVGSQRRTLDVDMTRGRQIVEARRSGADERELRALLWDTGSVGSTVPTDLSSELYGYVTASVALMRMPTRKIFTDGGNNLEFPKVAAHGIGTQVIAQGTAIGGTDATFDKLTLGAYKYGQLTQLSTETLEDSGVDILGFVAENVGRAVGEVIATDLAVGSGTGEPNGVMSAITGAGTIATGGSLIDPTYEKLVDLVYSVNGNYRARPSAAWLMRDLTAAAVRKIRDGSGGTLGAAMWVPSLTQGIQGAEPDLLLGHPVWTDPNVASLASNAKVIAFGDFSSYYIRVAKGFTLERSDEYAFNTGLVSFRGTARVDADCIDTTALNIMKRSV